MSVRCATTVILRSAVLPWRLTPGAPSLLGSRLLVPAFSPAPLTGWSDGGAAVTKHKGWGRGALGISTFWQRECNLQERRGVGCSGRRPVSRAFRSVRESSPCGRTTITDLGRFATPRHDMIELPSGRNEGHQQGPDRRQCGGPAGRRSGDACGLSGAAACKKPVESCQSAPRKLGVPVATTALLECDSCDLVGDTFGVGPHWFLLAAQPA